MQLSGINMMGRELRMARPSGYVRHAPRNLPYLSLAHVHFSDLSRGVRAVARRHRRIRLQEGVSMRMRRPPKASPRC
eukprot:COSAG04_NODE_1471_length_6586_cov_1.959149_6_plen_77_part_00